ncbi:MAG: hypothetical protein H6732_15390 [Alphaproteobacteria bacterium]|nr:hypothetical protein [Alphaproteobacteria bacterium]
MDDEPLEYVIRDLMTRARAGAATSGVRRSQPSGRELQALVQRVDHLELILEALLRWLELEGRFDRDLIASLIARVDLADGQEDDRIGPEMRMDAAACPACGKPLSTRRDACIYCGAPRPEELRTPRGHAPGAVVLCVDCGVVLREDKALRSASGPVCWTCFQDE